MGYRTNIILEKYHHHFLTELARKRRQSVSGIIRELVDREFRRMSEVKGDDPVMSVIGMAAGEKEHTGRKHDEELYHR